MLAWSVPILSVVLVWPWLFAVPGWVLVRRVAPDLPRPGVVGVGIVASTYLSAHLVGFVSGLDGFGRIAVLVSVLLLALATLAACLVPARRAARLDPAQTLTEP